MTTVIPGNDVILTGDMIVSAIGRVITREPSVTSNDVLADVFDIAILEYGLGYNPSGEYLTITIVNNGSNNANINIAAGNGMTFQPSNAFAANSDSILNGGSKTYRILFTTDSTALVYLESSTAGPDKVNIATSTPGTLLVGGTNGAATEVSMHGEGSMDHLGEFTLGSSIAGATSFSNSTDSTDSSTGAVMVTGGVGVQKSLHVGTNVTVGSVVMSDQKITGLSTPIDASDAAPKGYVDAFISGLSWKVPVLVVERQSNLPLSGVPTVDTVTTSVDDRILLVNQTDEKENGIWLIKSGAWERPADFNTTCSAASMFVTDGSVGNKGTGWVCTNVSGTDVIGQNDIQFVQFTSGSVGITDIKVGATMLTGPSVTFSVGSTGSDVGVTTATNEVVYNIPSAASGVRGVIDTKSQELSGEKTFLDGILSSTGSIGLQGATNTITIDAGTPSVDYTLSLPSDAGSNEHILQNTGSGTMEWTKRGALAYYYCYGPNADSNPIEAPPSLVDMTDGVISSGVADFTNAGGLITIVKAGIYKLSYWAQFRTLNSTGGTRASGNCMISKINGGLFTDETGSIASCYIREQNSAAVRPGCGKTILMDLSAGDQLGLRVYRHPGTSAVVLIANQCNLQIERIR